MINQQPIEAQIAMNQQADINRKHGELVERINKLDAKLDMLISLAEATKVSTKKKG